MSETAVMNNRADWNLYRNNVKSGQSSTMSPAEFQAYASSMYPRLTSAQIKEIFNRADQSKSCGKSCKTDANGTLAKREFDIAIKNLDLAEATGEVSTETDASGESETQASQTESTPKDYKSVLSGMSKDEIGQLRRDIRYSTSANGNFTDFVADSSYSEFNAMFDNNLNGSSSYNDGYDTGEFGDMSYYDELQAIYQMRSNTPSLGAALAADAKGMIALLSGDQAPGGKIIYNKDANIGGDKLHRTGVGRHTVANDGSEIFTVDTTKGFLSGVSKTPRVESFFAQPTQGKTFSATYQATGANFTSIFQHKGKSGGDQIQVYYQGGKIVAKDNHNNSHVLGTVQDGAKFSLQATDVGGNTVITVADASGRTLGSKSLSNGGAGAFRYGAYTSHKEQGAVQVQVWNANLR